MKDSPPHQAAAPFDQAAAERFGDVDTDDGFAVETQTAQRLTAGLGIIPVVGMQLDAPPGAVPVVTGKEPFRFS